MLGKTVSGEPYIVDLAAMPHMLIAGATGAGKSVCVHAMISSILYRMPPDLVKFTLIDPKRLELPSYSGIPHLYDHGVGHQSRPWILRRQPASPGWNTLLGFCIGDDVRCAVGLRHGDSLAKNSGKVPSMK